MINGVMHTARLLITHRHW